MLLSPLLLLAAASVSVDLGPVDAFVEAERVRQKVPGVAVAIVSAGEVLEARGYGLANVEHGVAVKPETIFQSGSVGKQFTATAVMLLVEDGKLALSDPITRLLPGAPSSWAGITVRHLLTHTSGIPDYTPETVDYRKDYSENELANLAFGLEPEFPPGARWSYSNTGYILLGIIVGRVSGRFYGELLAERVFAPLGMKTARVISEEDIVPNRAAGYRLVDGVLKLRRDPLIVRYLGNDLTIVVLANSDEARPAGIADGIAARLDPRLAKPELAPIPDTEPQVTGRLRQLLGAAAKGELKPEEFAYVRAGFFPYGAKWLQERLAKLGPALELTPLKREDLGDDRVHTYDVRYATETFRVVLALAPEGEISRFSVTPR